MDMNRIEEQARYYQNLPLRDRGVKAVVHLEDAEDELFWNHQLQKASPATYHFLVMKPTVVSSAYATSLFSPVVSSFA